MSRRPKSRDSAISAAVAAVIALAAFWWTSQHGSTDTDPPAGHGRTSTSSYAPSYAPSTTPSTQGTDPASGLPYVALSSLPPEAAQTVRLIDAGGPFPYPDHDGGTFGNYEGLLPQESSGYYKEYTVPTPGSPDRGARRIIAGSDGTLYWTGDHYDHFAVIRR